LRNVLRDFDYVEQVARNQFVAREFAARQVRSANKSVGQAQ
jgi:glycerol-3-phosphate O-acyltransferase